MKKRLSLALALVLTLSGAVALANMNVLRTERNFSMNFADLDGAEMHAMALQEGDELYISTIITGGTLSLVIRENAGDILYMTDTEPPPGFTVEIPETGIYRFTVTGQHASGSVWINLKTATDPSGGMYPFERERIRSVLGYTLEYDPSLFEYTHGEDVDRYFIRSEQLDGMPEISMLVSRWEGGLNELADQLLAEDGMQELSPSIVDWRAARTIRHQPGSEFGSPVKDYTLIELSETEILHIVRTYFVGVEDAAQRMQNMIDSIQFVY